LTSSTIFPDVPQHSFLFYFFFLPSSPAIYVLSWQRTK
jgi:hypothetical protein